MSNIVEVKDFTEITPHMEAIKLHNEIITNGTIAAQALYELCRCLKRMRDEKLYTQLGFDDFDTYCEQKANIKKRQAYNYIKTYEDLGSGFLQSNASLGITKLELLTHVPALDRADFMENNSVSDLSVAELKSKIEELERENGAKCEQISLLQEQMKERTAKNDDSEYNAKVEELTTQIAEMKKSMDGMISPAELKKLEKEKKSEIKAATEKAVREAIDKERKSAAKDYEDKFAEKEKEYRNKISGYEKKLADKDANISAAVRKQAELEERLKAASHDDSAKFRIYFEQLNDIIEKLFEALDGIEDAAQKKKFSESLTKLAEGIKAGAMDA